MLFPASYVIKVAIIRKENNVLKAVAILCFRVSWLQGRNQCSGGAVLLAPGEGLPSILSVVVAGGIQGLAGCWLDATLSSLPHGPLQYGSWFYQSHRRESASKTEVTVFHDLIVKVTSHHSGTFYSLEVSPIHARERNNSI